MMRGGLSKKGRLADFTAWCQSRGVSWLPGTGGVVLRPRRRADGAELLIAEREGEWRLFGPQGDMLAAASDLPELLDAIDAGVAANGTIHA